MEQHEQVAVKQRTPRGTYSEVARGSGIYAIINTSNGKRYIGSARCMRDRFATHRRDLRKGTHHSQKLQRAWDKHGEAAFTFIPLISCAPENQLLYEQIALDHYQSQKNGYNVLPTAGNRAGFKHSAETRARMSASSKGRKISDEVREKCRQRMLNYSPSPETRAKISAFNKGKKMSAEAVAKMRGRVVSEETRRKISEKLKGHPVSDESRAKMSAGVLAHNAKKRGEK